MAPRNGVEADGRKKTRSFAKKQRITVRLTPRQMQCLKELKDGLGTSYSLLTRSIIQDFITRNEDHLEKIMVNKDNDYADNQYTEED